MKIIMNDDDAEVSSLLPYLSVAKSGTLNLYKTFFI